MAKLFDKDGNEVEALTEEEQKEFKEKAIEEFKSANPDIVNVDKIKSDLETAQKELEDLKEANKDKDKNLGGARKSIEEKEKEIENLKKQMTDAVTGIKKFVVDRSVSDLIKRVSKGDEELAKKIKHHFDKTLSGMAQETDEEIATKINAALKLSDAPASSPETINSDIAGSGNGGGGHGGGNENKPSSELAAFAAKHFGISAEDWKKYGGKK